MRGKTVIITGATSGIGEIAAIHLAGQGARIVFTARDEKRAAATMAKLRAVNDAADHRFHLCDLSLIAEQKRVAGLLAVEPRIDVLINNAGALFSHRRETAEGLEMTFALNHMSYFTVTNLLLERLTQTPCACIVSVASGAHRRARLDFSDLQSRRHYRGFKTYARSKLCNVLFTHTLAKRLAGTGITANCLHPGFVATRFGDSAGGWFQYAVMMAKKLTAISEEEGAKTIIHLASSPEVAGISGEYFDECRIGVPEAYAQNDADADLLWRKSEKVAASIE